MSGKEQVSVTQPGGLYVDENLVPNGCGDFHILEVEPTTDSVEYKRFHVRPPASLPSLRTDLACQSGRQSHGSALCRFDVGQSSRIGGLRLVLAAIHVPGISLK